jgi:hypothetical protein
MLTAVTLLLNPLRQTGGLFDVLAPSFGTVDLHMERTRRQRNN